MKPIKFDLKLNNGEITLAYLKDIETNLTPALFQHFHTGKLAKWLRVRKLDEHAEKMEALLEAEKAHQIQLFKNLCAIFSDEISEEKAREAMQNYQKPDNSQIESSDNEVEQLILALKKKEFEIELLKNPLKFNELSKLTNLLYQISTKKINDCELNHTKI